MTRWRLWVILACVVGILVACGGESTPTPEEETSSSPVQWLRDPLHVVFRADIVGGERSAWQTANHIPDCTIYGDGRVVWTNDSSGGLQVLFDFLTDLTIQDFISFLAIDARIYTYEEGFPLQLPQSVTPAYAQITVEVSGRKHVTDSYGNWESDLYSVVLEACRTLSKTPRRFVPTGAWLSATPADPGRDIPTVYWDSEASGFNFGALALDGSKMWIEGNIVRALWANIVEDPAEVRFDDRFGVYMLTLQVPGVTLDAPPAPAE